MSLPLWEKEKLMLAVQRVVVVCKGVGGRFERNRDRLEGRPFPNHFGILLRINELVHIVCLSAKSTFNQIK
jgi:hypothetical protein